MCRLDKQLILDVNNSKMAWSRINHRDEAPAISLIHIYIEMQYIIV